jgi:hypothetical protein
MYSLAAAAAAETNKPTPLCPEVHQFLDEPFTPYRLSDAPTV